MSRGCSEMRLFTVSFLLFLMISTSYGNCPDGDIASDSITPLTELKTLYDKIKNSEPAMCHPLIEQLDYVKVKYWGFDEKEHVGILLIHNELSQDILEIFKSLFKYHYPIEKMQSPSATHIDDDILMANNVTGAFSCREVTGQPGILSQHSYGRAIDINPLINPYVKGDLIIPPAGKQFIARDKSHRAKITRDSLIYRLFTERGWDWGGHWYELADYQHFEKRANDELRNRNGYPKKAVS